MIVLCQNPFRKQKCRWIKEPYFGHISHPLCEIRKPHNLTPNKSSLSSIKDPVHFLINCEVYMPCDDCDTDYIGETERPFSVRLHEHLASKVNSSAFSKPRFLKSAHFRFCRLHVIPTVSYQLLALPLSLDCMW